VDPLDPAPIACRDTCGIRGNAPSLFEIASDARLDRPAEYPDWLTRGLGLAREACPEVFLHVGSLFAVDASVGVIRLWKPRCWVDGCAGSLHRLLSGHPDGGRPGQCYRPVPAGCGPISSAFAGAGSSAATCIAEFVLPYEQRVGGRPPVLGDPVYTHTCGSIGDRLDLMAQTGLDGIDTLDPPRWARSTWLRPRRVRHQLFFKGNLDAVTKCCRRRRPPLPAGRHRAVCRWQAGVGLHPVLRLFRRPARRSPSG